MAGLINGILLCLGVALFIWGAYKLTSWAEKKAEAPPYHDIENSYPIQINPKGGISNGK